MEQRVKKPDWLRVRPPSGKNYKELKENLRTRGLATVCEEAACPNLGECWSGGTATIMVLGDVCTRGCRFCNVKTGNPKGELDHAEPEKVASMLQGIPGLNYVVITTVDRDDLVDHGAAHFAKIVATVKRDSPNLKIETLAQDFRGEAKFVHQLIDSGLDVFAHNLETVDRLTSTVRDRRAGYQLSLSVLKIAKEYRPDLLTKSSLMVGFGESKDEVVQAMQDLRAVGVNILTFGQYLQPSRRHIPVERYVHPDEFKSFEQIGLDMGFDLVPSGPLVP